jgi:hypothetical protein
MARIQGFPPGPGLGYTTTPDDLTNPLTRISHRFSSSTCLPRLPCSPLCLITLRAGNPSNVDVGHPPLNRSWCSPALRSLHLLYYLYLSFKPASAVCPCLRPVGTQRVRHHAHKISRPPPRRVSPPARPAHPHPEHARLYLLSDKTMHARLLRTHVTTTPSIPLCPEPLD